MSCLASRVSNAGRSLLRGSRDVQRRDSKLLIAVHAPTCGKAARHRMTPILLFFLPARPQPLCYQGPIGEQCWQFCLPLHTNAEHHVAEERSNSNER